ncbi:amino acid adenylation domain-containing protein [Actinomadura chokoriensis]|uniref:Amino acid adenylation domain-containing protein n=1 Tax=Actinomadura chokoriensis TaxID=454156 RepID=A0ABV4R466_9ACTN
MRLHELVIAGAERTPNAPAVDGPDGPLTYLELDREANRIARALTDLGVGPGDRVGLWMDKSARMVAAMQGVLRLGAMYVPLDPLSPVDRIARIVSGCRAAAVISTPERSRELAARVRTAHLCTGPDGAGPSWGAVTGRSGAALPDPPVRPDDPAYILYTSGSTGEPKGVCISHRNALAFVEWAAAELRATPEDRFANHAPFHFDLSVLDLYVAFSCGASVHLVPQGTAYAPHLLTDFLVRRRITVWYSVPSVLILMISEGGLLDLEPPEVRAVLFAGEPFPIRYLRRLQARWPHARLLNLYGPTETNVCTFHEVKGPIPAEQTLPVPIGKACSGDRVWARRADGGVAAPGEEGELIVSGPTVMLGYWGRPGQDGAPYATGDIVRLREDGAYEFVGRRDALVKVRGHRIELGEIESTLLRDPAIAEAAAAVVGAGPDARLVAFLVGAGGSPPGLLAVKRLCARHLPRQMIVDDVLPLPELPRTSTGKIDRRRLTEMAPKRLT